MILRIVSLYRVPTLRVWDTGHGHSNRVRDTVGTRWDTMGHGPLDLFPRRFLQEGMDMCLPYSLLFHTAFLDELPDSAIDR